MNPNIEEFNNKVRALGIETNDPRINERALYRTYISAQAPTLDNILQADKHDDDDMDISLQIV